MMLLRLSNSDAAVPILSLYDAFCLHGPTGPTVYMIDLFVQPDSRGIGAGQALMAFCAGLAVEAGCARLTWNVDTWNENGQQFYR